VKYTLLIRRKGHGKELQSATKLILIENTKQWPCISAGNVFGTTLFRYLTSAYISERNFKHAGEKHSSIVWFPNDYYSTWISRVL